MAELAVLLRDGTNSGATDRLALKAEQLSLSFGRQPIQIPLPAASPVIIDLCQSKLTGCTSEL